MQLIRRHHRDDSVARNLFGEIRDLGARLEHLTSRYERLVRDMEAATVATVGDVQARVRMANRELSFVATQLQQLLVEQYETSHGALQSKAAAAAGLLNDVPGVPFRMLRDVANA